jgi:tetratricopeptide (TPR) repeat protein
MPCAVEPSKAVNVSDAQRRRARDLAQRAQQSAILGDRLAARDQLKEAASLDPANANLAYELARAQESANSSEQAAHEYCRFLSLAPNAPEASEARDRVAALTQRRQRAVSEPALAAFRVGLQAFDRKNFTEAETAFGSAIDLAPEFAEAYYDRGLARTAHGDPGGAAQDFADYARLAPTADDRAAVLARVDALRAAALSPGNALAVGLVIPGGGQFYTGRSGYGLLTLAAVGGALAWGLQSTTTNVHHTGVDPFGQKYDYTTPEASRAHLGVGLGVAGGIALATALEAFTYAQHANSRARTQFAIAPIPGGAAVGVKFAFQR